MARPDLFWWWRGAGIIILWVNHRDWYITSRGFSRHCIIGHCRERAIHADDYPTEMVRALPEPEPVTVIFRLSICVERGKHNVL